MDVSVSPFKNGSVRSFVLVLDYYSFLLPRLMAFIHTFKKELALKASL